MATTISAGTFTSLICRECPDGSGGTTATAEKNTPHPTWTNSNGDAVVQLQMVTLGGQNGLNS